MELTPPAAPPVNPGAGKTVDLAWMRQRASELGLHINDEDLEAVRFQFNKMRAAFARAAHLGVSSTPLPVIFDPGEDRETHAGTHPSGGDRE